MSERERPERGLQTIVCVEADPDNRHLLQRVLEQTGRYRVVGATDGVSGLEQIKQHRPVLALVDLDLPVISAFELLRRLRSDAELAVIPVVAISASVMRGERQRCLDSGFLTFIEKPFDIHEFREMIGICIERSRGGHGGPRSGLGPTGSGSAESGGAASTAPGRAGSS